MGPRIVVPGGKPTCKAGNTEVIVVASTVRTSYADLRTVWSGDEAA